MEAPMRSLLPLLLVVALHPDAALCQSPPPAPVARADITASIGSFGAKRAEAPEYNQWTHSWFASVGGGYYWTDHLKTELALDSRGRSEVSSSESAGVPTSPLSSIYLRHV